MRFVILAVCAMGLFGCTYQAAVDVSPAYNVYSSYEDKVGGRWALYMDLDRYADHQAKFSGFQCSAHSLDIGLDSAFRDSAVRTLQNIVEEVEMVDSPLSREQLTAGDLRGLIILKGEEVRSDLKVIPGFWSSEIEADVDLALGITIDGESGRLLGTTVSGRGRNRGSAGSFCDGAGPSLGKAGSEAIRDVLGRTAERISNASRVREVGI